MGKSATLSVFDGVELDWPIWGGAEGSLERVLDSGWRLARAPVPSKADPEAAAEAEAEAEAVKSWSRKRLSEKRVDGDGEGLGPVGLLTPAPLEIMSTSLSSPVRSITSIGSSEPPRSKLAC